MYFILQAKLSQLKAFAPALSDADHEILHTLPNGPRDSFWAYSGENKHGYLLKQLCKSKIMNKWLTNPKTHSVGTESCTTSSITSPRTHSVHGKSCTTSSTSMTSQKPNLNGSKPCISSSLTNTKMQLVVNLVQILH